MTLFSKRSRESQKAAFANMSVGATTSKYHKYDESMMDYSKIDLDVNSDKYRKWLMKNTMDEYVQLDPRFPNLKGVTPREVEEFLTNDIHDKTYYDLENDFKKVKDLEEISSIYERDLDAYLRLNTLMNNYSFDEVRLKIINEKNIHDSKMTSQYDESDEALVLAFENIVINVNNENKLKSSWKDIINNKTYDLESKINNIGQRKRQILNSITEELPQFKDFRVEYLKHVKVYDRDEIFEDSKKIGKELRNRLVELGAIPSSGNLHNLTGNTIFITTPRGGHEILSIFSYANNLRKWSIPSLIEDSFWTSGNGTKRAFKEGLSEGYIRGYNKGDAHISDNDFTLFKNGKFKELIDGEYRIYGNDWLNSAFSDSNVKNVVFVDDIIASGQQIKDVISKVSKVFHDSDNKINFIPVSLSARDDRFDNINETTYYSNINLIKPIYANKMIDLDTFKMRFLNKINKPNEYVSVAFPWSIPDGESDKLLTQLYGDRYERNRLRRKFGEGSK